MKDKMPRVHHLVMAVDCGTVGDPAIVRVQVEGAIYYRLAMALTSKITIAKGRLEQSNFYDYTVVRQRTFRRSTLPLRRAARSPRASVS